MRLTFLYPSSPKSPHFVHLSWAKSVCNNFVQTPMGLGLFDIRKIPKSDALLLESLYCLPFAKKYKQKINPQCKIISIIADTSFWRRKLSLARRIYYALYLDCVDGFIAVSERIKKDILNYVDRPVEVVRPFFVGKFQKETINFEKKILFVGNEVKEKGFPKLIKAMELLPDFELFLVGDCYKAINKTPQNTRVEGRVPRLEKYFNSCSYYVHPADFDPCPASVFEAMYAGLIPIITKDVGQSELFTKDLRCLILENNNPETIAKKLMEVHGYSTTRKRRIVKRCREIAKRYTKERSIREFKKAFYRLV